MHKRTSILFCFACCAVITNAQVNDAALWLGFTAEKKLTSKFSLQLSEEFRFNENITELATVFTEFGASYKIIKGLTGSAAYRFTQKRRIDDFFSIRHRYQVDLAYKLKFKKFSLTIRERFQSRYKNVYTDEKGLIPANYLRSKFTLKYNPERKYSPFAVFEFFYPLNNPKGNTIDNIRYQLGLDYGFNKFSSVNLAYIIDKEINVKNPWTSYIIALGYKYSF